MQRLVKSISRILPKPRTLANPTTTASSRPIATTAAVHNTNNTKQTSTTDNMGSIAASSTPAAAGGRGAADNFLELIAARRSFYPLNKELTVPAARVQEIVGHALQHVPSSFNSQSNRVVVLQGAEHDALWDLTAEVLRGVVPADQWEPTGNKMAMFRAAAGTALFFEDQTAVEGMQTRFPLYADRFPVWAGHSNAMLQFAVWTALEAEGLGANLQHYNPLIDAKVAEKWKLPTTWKLTAQLVYGGRAVADAGEKTFLPLEEKLKVFGA